MHDLVGFMLFLLCFLDLVVLNRSCCKLLNGPMVFSLLFFVFFRLFTGENRSHVEKT